MQYEVRATLPTVKAYLSLREAAGMSPRSREGAERGLPNTLFAATAFAVDGDGTETPVGMGRVVGDGGTVYQIVDMAVHPDHQGAGLGTKILDELLAFLDEDAPPNAYVNLVADVDGFYERFGFEETRPASKAMYLSTE
ncbi:GNAT family N-acetyltransferase [Haloprofundus sp. MHR1]|uniref:GNAT family N-acetyltransferase n=1 Tax=Haloprofundus sp. MHR1 TaxID=2572921 RepID=UPI0010BE9E9A|nr:GNAT family N-acetyltransferase [Haloprofundus sp. MHR1]QCJ47754.1 GNAT family N-acetyltransferase [Haloprofundus sp. MHR1]